MARLLQILPIESPTSMYTTGTLIFVVAAILAVCSIISFLCTSDKHIRSRRYGGDLNAPSIDRKLMHNISGISSKALLMAKMISWRKVDVGDEEAVWKKTIIMGERCRPLDFSGRIVYDSEGNQVPDLPKRAPRKNGVITPASTENS